MDKPYIRELRLSRAVMREFDKFLHHEGNHTLIKEWHPSLFKAYEDLSNYYDTEREEGIP